MSSILRICRRQLAVSLFALAAVTVPVAAGAQQVAAPQGSAVIAVLDVDQVYRDSQAGKGVLGQAEKYQQTFVQENTKEEGELRTAQQDLANEQQKKVLSQEAFSERVKEFEAKVGQYKNRSFAREKAFQKSYNTAMGQLQKAMFESAQEVAQAHAFTMVMPRAQVILFDEKMNITKDVVVAMDKKTPHVDFPAPKVEAELEAAAAAAQGGASKKKSQ